MNILTVVETVDIESAGGSAERARQLALHLKTLGHQSTILTTSVNYSDLTRSTLAELQVITLRSMFNRFWVPHPRFMIIGKLIKNSDVVHIINHWTILGLLSYIFCKAYNKPYFISPLGSLIIFGRSKILKRIYNLIIGRKIITNSSGCIVATLNEVNNLNDLGIYPEHTFHIPNGVNETKYPVKMSNDYLEALGLHNQYIVFIGRLYPIKGPDLLLQAFLSIADEIDNLDLVLIGPDEGMAEELKETALINGLDSRVHFLGHVYGDNKTMLIQESLFLVVPSRREAMSIVALEAGILAKPVLLTDVCGFNEVQDVGGGLVVKPDHESIYHGIKTLINNKEELGVMGQRLQTLVKQNYLWSSAATEHEKIFKSAMSNQELRCE